jgi:uncharacterized membrane protein YphA (DoxX/SURF4 family)
VIGTVAAVVLGAAFVVAGGAKLADRSWPASAGQLGVSTRLARAVPVVELIVGGALVAGLAAPIPALVAALLLVAFTAVIAMALLRGERPPCACFGQVSAAKPIGPMTLLRNTALFALAVLATLA